MKITHTQLDITIRALLSYFCDEDETIEEAYISLGSLEKNLIDRAMKEKGLTLKELQTL